jgi:hypothetical protein
MNQVGELGEESRGAEMVHALGPGIIGSFGVFEPPLLPAHDFQNAGVLVFVEPVPVIGTKVHFEIEKAIIEPSQRGGAARALEIALAADKEQRPFVRLVTEFQILELVEFGWREPQAPADRTRLDLDAAIQPRLQAGITFWTFHLAENAERTRLMAREMFW